MDLKQISRRVVDKAITLGKGIDGEITLLHIRGTSPTSSHATANHSGHSAQEMIKDNNEMEKLEEKLRDSGLTFVSEQPTGDIMKILIGKVKDLSPEMVILGSAHNNALHHLVSGSVAGSLLDKTGIPVLLVPEEK